MRELRSPPNRPALADGSIQTECGQLGIFTLIKADEVMNRPHVGWLAFFFLSPLSVPPRTEHHISLLFLEGAQDLFLMRLKTVFAQQVAEQSCFWVIGFLWLMHPPFTFEGISALSLLPFSHYKTSPPLYFGMAAASRMFRTITILPAMNLAVFCSRPLSTWCVRLTLNWEGQVFPWLRRFAGCG